MAMREDDEDGGYAIHTGKRLEDSDFADLSVEPSYRSVGVFSLLVIAFFWASGGIYGNEVGYSAMKFALIWF